MASLRKKNKGTARSYRSTRRPKPDRRWTLLFIGNHGRTLTLKRFKGMVLITLLVLSIAVAAAAGLLVWNQKLMRDNEKLESDIGTMREKLSAIRHEKDILTTRLVLAESKVPRNTGDSADKQSKEEPAEQNKPAEPTKGDSEIAAKSETPVAKPVQKPVQKPSAPEAKKNNAPSESGLSVAIENFKITSAAGNTKLRVQFKIKNTTPGSRRVSGHAIVVLKGDQLKKGAWLSIPGMPLVAGRPTGRHRGYSFGINYFRTMRFSTVFPKHPEKYQTASVYVFENEGDLLLEQDFAVKLPPSQKTASKQLSHDALLNALKNPSP